MQLLANYRIDFCQMVITIKVISCFSPGNKVECLGEKEIYHIGDGIDGIKPVIVFGKIETKDDGGKLKGTEIKQSLANHFVVISSHH